jgi:CRISPR-associated protein Cmr2
MMQYYQFTLGPVQGFVAQARRTWDYWSGSFLLSYLTGKAMLAIIENGGRIVFPAVQNEDGTITDSLLAAIQEDRPYPSIGSIPNRFTAKVPEGFEGGTCTKAVELAWQDLAENIWQRYLADVAETLGNGSYETWQRQINSFWDMSWIFGEDTDLLDRRKNWRSHIPSEEPGDKCTLMGNLQELSGYLRISHRKKQDEFWQALSDRIPGYNLHSDERLCGIALVKRLFPLIFKTDMEVAYPSTPYLAAIPWLSSVINDPQEQGKARDFAKAASNKFMRTPYTFDVGNMDHDLAKFVSLEGNCYFQSTLENGRLWEEWKSDERVQTSLNKLKNLLKDFKAKPAPFYALLLMDGDRIGELLNDINNRTGISKAIGRFSARVDTIVRKYKGVTVYAGGDDVAALLPMDQALGAAEALQRQYQESFEQLDLHKKPSISAAIVYAHHHTPLNQIIAKAHQVLDKKAKEETGRDAVAVAVYKTGGEVIIWSSPWQVIDSNGNSTSICEIINGLTSDLRHRQLTNSWIYGIRKLLGNSFENRFTSPEGRKDNEENDGMLGRGNRFTIPEGLDLTHLLTAQLMDSRDIDTDVIKAQKIVRHLLTLCAHQYRDGEGRIKREDNTFTLDPLF